MTELELIYSILEKTIGALKDNKVHMLDIIKNLKKDYESKLNQLHQLKEQIPVLVDKNTALEAKDKQLRKSLANASNNLSSIGEANLKQIYKDTAQLHSELLYSLNQEKFLRDRRNMLELELKQSLNTISSAEKMAQQISVALAYLEKDLFNKLASQLEPEENISLATHILDALEHEKARIGRDLHDGPAQHLASVLMRIDFCKLLIQKDLMQGVKELDNLKSSIKLSLSEVRDILFDLTPAPLETVGLETSLMRLIDTLFQQSSSKIDISLQLPSSDLSQTLQTTIYRTVQEILNNTKKHAEASIIKITLTYTPDSIEISIVDNGKGFDVAKFLATQPQNQKSYGVMNIISRTKQLSGDIQIKSTLGLGTRYLITLPIDLSVGGNSND